MKFPTRIIAVLVCVLGLIYTVAGCSSAETTSHQSSSSDFIASEPVK